MIHYGPDRDSTLYVCISPRKLRIIVYQNALQPLQMLHILADIAFKLILSTTKRSLFSHFLLRHYMLESRHYIKFFILYQKTVFGQSD